MLTDTLGDIHNLFIVPAALIDSSLLRTGYYDVVIGNQTIVSDVEFKTIRTDSFSSSAYNFETSVSKLTSFGGTYTPKNNKCYVYPYNYLMVTNNAGSQNIYKYEFFSDTSCKFDVQLAMAIGCSGRSVPKNYKGVVENIDECLPLAKYPTCSWSSDAYTNWLTQNSVNITKQNVNIGFTGAKGVVGVVGNLLSGNIGGALTSGFDTAQSLTNQVLDLEGSFYQARLLPSITGGNNDGDVNFASLDIGFKYMRMRCNDKYLRIIDDYFTRFGYKTLVVKIPNLKTRKYWNYLQIGAGESLGYGSIPQNALDIINMIAQKGFTVWHDATEIGNYDLNNVIL